MEYAIAYNDKFGNGFTETEPWILDDFHDLEICKSRANELIKSGYKDVTIFSDVTPESMSWDYVRRHRIDGLTVNDWRYFIVLNDPKYRLNNIVEGEDWDGNGLPICQDFSVAINFYSTEQLFSWVKKNTNLVIENNDFHIEGYYGPVEI